MRYSVLWLHELRDGAFFLGRGMRRVVRDNFQPSLGLLIMLLWPQPKQPHPQPTKRRGLPPVW